jgi:hypothetical protein
MPFAIRTHNLSNKESSFIDKGIKGKNRSNSRNNKNTFDRGVAYKTFKSRSPVNYKIISNERGDPNTQ